jgi:uncharacterized peroxidase-related enzyme
MIAKIILRIRKKLSDQGAPMKSFKVYDETNAPEKSQAKLAAVKKSFGLIPNVIGILAESPPVLEAYLDLNKKLEATSLSPQELQVVILSINRANGCTYCIAIHTGIAKSIQVPENAIASLRNGTPLDDPRLDALAEFADKMVEKQGWLDAEDVEEFLSAGYTQANVLDVILAVAQKTISNYSNHIAHTPVDEEFSEFAWDGK